MYDVILSLHSIFRWLVIISLVFAIFKAWQGYSSSRPYTKTDNAIRHWTATIAHTQLIFGTIIYIKSPITKYFWSNFSTAIQSLDTAFFGLYHMLLMLAAIAFLTIGSAKAKRKENDKAKFHTMFSWFLIAFIIILIAIPWPFSPFANRPYIRTF